jgi:hypothetical protein
MTAASKYLSLKYDGIFFSALAAIIIIMLAGSSVGTTTIVNNVKAATAAVSSNNSNNNNTALCLDGDAADDTYWVGCVDAINDFHHIKRYGITAFFDPQAEAGYHRGYQAGWADATLNGTTIDPGCWDTRIK